MGPAFPAEYEQRSDYYDQWLKEAVSPGQIIPDTLVGKHRLLIEQRQKAYQTLCDIVYKAKGYNRNAVPLPETLEKFGILDDKANSILEAYRSTAGIKN